MPVAAPSQKEPQVPSHFRHLLPKPPGPNYGSAPNHGQLSPNHGVVHHQESASFMADTFSQYATNIPPTGASSDSQSSGPSTYFNTHSPPILNLSPNLSPSEAQRSSPGYDLRDSTRRRSVQDVQNNLNQQLPLSPAYHYSGIIPDDTDRKVRSESPRRKRRKLSHSVIDLTAASPSPPPSRPWEMSASELHNQPSTRQRSASQQHRRLSVERCLTPRTTRRSPPATRRRTRERTNQSPERRAFQPVNLPPRQIHPAAMLPQMTQHPIVIDVDQLPVSHPAVSMPPYATPVCSGPHHIPMCTAPQMHMCTTSPTWSIPPCSMPIPSCSIQHLPPSCLQQLPTAMTHHPAAAAMPPILPPPHHPHPASHHPHLSHHPHHIPPPSQFIPSHHQSQPHHPHQEEDVQLITEHRPGPHHYMGPAVPHHGPPLTATPPQVLLQEPTVHPTPHDFFNPFSRFRRATTNRTRWRSIPPPPPAYPGFLLHFLAMLGNPPVPPYGMDLNDETGEVENYEALLNLAERLGEAKPRGLLKTDIEQLPSYRFNAEINRSTMDQTSCVVCMCDFEGRQLLRVLPCSHEFHAKCVDKWLKSNRTCPICRADASEGLSQSE